MLGHSVRRRKMCRKNKSKYKRTAHRHRFHKSRSGGGLFSNWFGSSKNKKYPKIIQSADQLTAQLTDQYAMAVWRPNNLEFGGNIGLYYKIESNLNNTLGLKLLTKESNTSEIVVDDHVTNISVTDIRHALRPGLKRLILNTRQLTNYMNYVITPTRSYSEKYKMVDLYLLTASEYEQDKKDQPIVQLRGPENVIVCVNVNLPMETEFTYDVTYDSYSEKR